MAQPLLEFFRFDAAGSDSPRVPTVTPFRPALGEWLCPECGRRWTPIRAPISCEVEGGAAWTDALRVSDWSKVLVSQRVVDSLDAIGATGFSPVPVEITQVNSRWLRGPPECPYFYLDIDGRIDIDWEASTGTALQRCGVCSSNLSEKVAEPRSYVPIPETWDGSDIFKIGPAPSWGMVFCSRRVLELARSGRWTNFRFEPMDVVRRRAAGWGGIDYLGETWPPEQWYPPSPSAGKPMEEWVEQMRSSDVESAREARIALTDLGEEAILSLSAMLDDPAEDLRREAARVLYYIDKHAPLAREVKRLVHGLLPADLAVAWSQDAQPES